MSDHCLCDQIETFVVVSLLDSNFQPSLVLKDLQPDSIFHKYLCVMESSFCWIVDVVRFLFCCIIAFLPPVSLSPSRVNQKKGAAINQTFTPSFKFVLKIPTLWNCQEQQ